jgi:hypothetical protein
MSQFRAHSGPLRRARMTACRTSSPGPMAWSWQVFHRGSTAPSRALPLPPPLASLLPRRSARGVSATASAGNQRMSSAPRLARAHPARREVRSLTCGQWSRSSWCACTAGMTRREVCWLGDVDTPVSFSELPLCVTETEEEGTLWYSSHA